MTDDLHSACAQAVHVLTLDGRRLKAGRAVLFVARALGYSKSARLGALPPFIWVIEASYLVVANHRGFFSKFLFKSE